MPNCARPKRGHAASEPWFLPFRRDPEVYVVLKPLVRIHIPALQIRPCILRRLQRDRVHICQSVPAGLLLVIETVVAEARQDTCAFSEIPGTVVFQACSETEGVDIPDSRAKLGPTLLLTL